jgi:hypothetical protein
MHLGQEELQLEGNHTHGIEKVLPGQSVEFPGQKYARVAEQEIVWVRDGEEAYTSLASELTSTEGIDRIFRPPTGFIDTHVSRHPPTYFSHGVKFDPGTASLDPVFLGGLPEQIHSFVEHSRFTK